MTGVAEIIQRWRGTHEGFAPLYNESIMLATFEHLAPALRPGAIVLDAACGAGQVAWALAVNGAATVGFDIESGPWRNSTWGPPEARFFLADLRRVPLPSASVDALFCFSALQYVDRDAALAEFSRVLRPGAPFAIVENLAGNPIVRGFRALRWLAGAKFPGNMTPRRHPAWREVAGEDPRFAARDVRAYALLSPLLLAQRDAWGWPADVGLNDGRRRQVERLERWDRAVFRRVPAAREFAWLALTLGRR